MPVYRWDARNVDPAAGITRNDGPVIRKSFLADTTA
jgi:hypothetical protein